MNKKEKIIVAVLVILLGLSIFFQYQTSKKNAESLAIKQQENLVQQESSTNQVDATSITNVDTNAIATTTIDNAHIVPLPVEREMVPEKTLEIPGENKVKYVFTSKGGAIKSVSLESYPKEVDSKDPVVLDFSNNPAMIVEPVEGYQKNYDDYSLEYDETNKTVIATQLKEEGLKIVKTFKIPTNGYNVVTTIKFENTTPSIIKNPDYYVSLGAMEMMNVDDKAMADIALDCRKSETGKDDFDVIACGVGELAELFGGSGGGCSAAKVYPAAPMTAEKSETSDVDWVTVRDRFFIQFLSPEGENGVGAKLFATRKEDINNLFIPHSASASILFKESEIPANGSSQEQTFSYYAGPRKMSELRKLGEDTIDIMNFGTWSFFCEWLLDFLNFIERNTKVGYGVAIILLTIIVRMVLFPINRKSAAGMRKMQEIQPLIKEINEKYKDDPQMRQQETMRVYGEHKINPLTSCLPMIIQLPIFVALFTILRSSVELRFERFLWVSDLSSPENLFQDTLGFGINILPILMAVTMGLQTYLTPSSGDPAQRKMMMVMMPVMMLVMFYSLPSALTLYWTVSQILAIIGILWSNKRNPVVNKDGVEVIAPPRETRQMRRKHK